MDKDPEDCEDIDTLEDFRVKTAGLGLCIQEVDGIMQCLGTVYWWH